MSHLRQLPLWFRARPLPSLTAVFAAMAVCTVPLPLLLFPLLPDGLTGQAVYETFGILWPLGLAALLGRLRIYREGNFIDTLWAGLAILTMEGLLLFSTAYMALENSGTQWRSPAAVLLGALGIAGIGFREETVFRGLVVNILGERWIRGAGGVWLTTVVSGFLFGAVHMVNWFSGVSLRSVLVQSAVAWAVGCTLCAVYLRGGNLWCMILLHAVTDASSLFYASFLADGDIVETLNAFSAINLLPILPFGCLTVFLLRPLHCRRIVRRFREKRAEETDQGAEQ